MQLRNGKETKLYIEGVPYIDFTLSEKHWRSNKINIGNGEYKYKKQKRKGN